MIKFLCYSVAISAVAAAIELFLCCGQIALNVGLKYSMFLAGNVVCSWSFCCFGVFLFVFFLLCVLLLLCSWKVLRVAFVFCSICCFFCTDFYLCTFLDDNVRIFRISRFRWCRWYWSSSTTTNTHSLIYSFIRYQIER